MYIYVHTYTLHYLSCIVVIFSKKMPNGLILGVHFLDLQGTDIIYVIQLLVILLLCSYKCIIHNFYLM